MLTSLTASPCVLDKLDEFPKGGQLPGPPALILQRQRGSKVVPPGEELRAEAPHGRRSEPVHYLPPVELLLRNKAHFIYV